MNLTRHSCLLVLLLAPVLLGFGGGPDDTTQPPGPLTPAPGPPFVDLGQPVRGQVFQPAQWHGWVFEGLAGTTVRWTVRGKGGLQPQVFVDGPDGAPVPLNAVGLGSGKLVIDEVVLPMDGLYLFRLEGLEGSTGKYRVTSRVTPPEGVEELQISLPPTGDPRVPHLVPFVAPSGARLIGRVMFDAPVDDLSTVHVQAPVGEVPITDKKLKLVKQGKVLRFKKLTLPQSGDHVLELGGALAARAVDIDLVVRWPKNRKKVSGRLLPGHVDTDGDGLLDIHEELIHDTDPLLADTDADGLGDGAEVGLHGTDPLDADSDDDGLPDGLDVALGLDPLLADPTTRLTGRAVDESGAPLPGIEAWADGWAAILPSVMTRSDGSFAMSWPTGVALTIRVAPTPGDARGLVGTPVGPVTPVGALHDLGDSVLRKLFDAPGTLLTAGLGQRVVHDIDGDGRPEVVGVLPDADALVVLGAETTGPVLVEAEHDVAGGPLALAVDDLDGDGLPDVAVARADGVVTLLRGTEDGALESWTSFAIGDSPSSVTLVDLDGDDLPELVTGHPTAVEIRSGISSGSPALTTVPLATGVAHQVAVLDVDGDALADLVVGRSLVTNGVFHGELEVHPGLSLGGFGPPATVVPTGSSVDVMQLAELDGLPGADVVVAGRGLPFVSVVTGLAAGGTLFGHLADDAQPGVQLIDLDGDLALDILVDTPSGVSVLAGDGMGGFAPAAPFVQHRGGLVVDLDDDGALDLVHGERVVVLQRAAAGTSFRERTPLDAFVGAALQGDLAGDAAPDLVLTEPELQVLRVHPATADPFGTPPVELPVAGLATFRVDLGDVDGDGALDLLAESLTKLAWHAAAGDGFGLPTTLESAVDPPGLVLGAFFADLDGDGQHEVVALRGGTLVVYSALASGAPAAEVPLQSQTFALRMAVGDLDGDGRDDVLITEPAADRVHWFAGSVGPSLAAPISVPTAPAPFLPTLADLDADGRPEVILVGQSQLEVLPGSADGPQSPGLVLQLPTGAFDVEVADVNGDGRADILALDQASRLLSVWYGVGVGGALAFTGPLHYAARGSELEVTDGNLDGVPEIVFVDHVPTGLGLPSAVLVTWEVATGR